MPPQNDGNVRVRLLDDDTGGKCRFYVNRVHAANANDVRLEFGHLTLKRASETLIDNANFVAMLEERSGDVFETERLDSEKGAQPKPLIG